MVQPPRDPAVCWGFPILQRWGFGGSKCNGSDFQKAPTDARDSSGSQGGRPFPQHGKDADVMWVLSVVVFFEVFFFGGSFFLVVPSGKTTCKIDVENPTICMLMIFWPHLRSFPPGDPLGNYGNLVHHGLYSPYPDGGLWKIPIKICVLWKNPIKITMFVG